MKEKLIKIFITEMYPVYMNGFAMAGLFTAAIYGVGSMIKELWLAFQ